MTHEEKNKSLEENLGLIFYWARQATLSVGKVRLMEDIVQEFVVWYLEKGKYPINQFPMLRFRVFDALRTATGYNPYGPKKKVIRFIDSDKAWDYAKATTECGESWEIKEKQFLETIDESPLSDRKKRILQMFFLGGYLKREIGTECGISESRVVQLMGSAKRELKSFLVNEGYWHVA